MKKIISLAAVSLMLSLVIIDSPAAFAGGGPVASAPVPAPQKAAPAPTTTPSAPVAPASNPASAPAATVPMANPYGNPYGSSYSGNYGSCDCGNGGCSAGYRQSCNRGTTVVVTTGSSQCSGCCARSGCCGGRGLVMRLMNCGNIAGARAVLRSMNRSFYFGGCASPCC